MPEAHAPSPRHATSGLGRRLAALLLAGLLACLPLAAVAASVELSESERAYLQARSSIPLCVDPDWWPFEQIDPSGQHVGMAADLIALVVQRSGASLRLHATRTWEESLAAAQRGECLALSFLNSTPDRDQWLIFTEPLLVDPNVIITREEHPFVSDIGALKGKSIALPRGTAMAERIARDFPELRIVPTESEREALSLVSERKADMTLRSLIVAAATIKHEGWFNLKISGQIPGYDNQLRMGVLKSETTLRDILDKGIATLTPGERRQIVDRHVRLDVVTGVVTDYSLALWVGLVLTAIAGTSLLWMTRLRKLNRQLKALAETDALTGLPNRNALNPSFSLDILRAQRYDRPLSVILLDIDHFKLVNDDFGHLTGDKVLEAFARLLGDGLREVDTVCRWGGEEFLIICHETDLEQAALLAGRLLQRVRSHVFPCPRRLTASAGVATVLRGDTVARLMQRADESLYDAKHHGRDRVGIKPLECTCAD
ncbi:diguanylate cyclase [Pseudomonas sp. AN-1]|uniref:diguanylate cyclase n=1 Tax=Pseudomonas sp. AN-1 TaxID=3096605 RepID=UPI002A6A5BB7|nr:diguanylate cyclase [Pseudomonas sp. AN-1]WPP45063.1 diguanylate cyclase [Pseudomonas sp. AN-1]